MTVFPRLAFLLFLVVSPIVVFVTSAPLPERVATHFGRGGLADGWMSHDGYIAFMLVMITVLPLVVTASSGLLPAAARSLLKRRAPRMGEALRQETVTWLGGHACLMGCLICALMLGIHFLTLEANARTPARLDESAFFAVLGAFVALLVIWLAFLGLRLYRRQE